jgi:NAD(P)H-quinone oxidoreductase subunit 5
MLEDAAGAHLTGDQARPPQTTSRRQLWLYRFALERGSLDALLDEWIIRPFLRIFRWFDSLERGWTDWLTGSASRESDRLAPYSDRLEDNA